LDDLRESHSRRQPIAKNSILGEESQAFLSASDNNKEDFHYPPIRLRLAGRLSPVLTGQNGSRNVSTYQNTTKSKISAKQKKWRVCTRSAESTRISHPCSMRKMLRMQKTEGERMESETKRRTTQKSYGQIYNTNVQRRSAGKIRRNRSK
jgi:hypothetical protein